MGSVRMTSLSARSAANCRRSGPREPKSGWSRNRPLRMSRRRRGHSRAGRAETIELRSALAAHLERAAFPAARPKLLETLRTHQAEQRLLDLVSSAPDGVMFANFGELVRALGLPVEHRPT